jgi:transcription elongation factor GreA
MSHEDAYLTKNGLEKLQAELDDLKNTKRPEITDRIAQAKELGDLAENAEYQSARNDQAFNEGRILELEAVLKQAVIIEDNVASNSEVSVGSKIKVKEHHDTGMKEKDYHIVGSHEADPVVGKISNKSPIGKALLGAKVGETLEITLPKGVIKAEIIKIN